MDRPSPLPATPPASAYPASDPHRPAGAARPAPTLTTRLAEGRVGSALVTVLPTVAITVGALTFVKRFLDGPPFGPFHGLWVVLLIAAGGGQLVVLRERRRLVRATSEATVESELALAQRADVDSRYRVLVEHVPAAVYVDIESSATSDSGHLEYMSPQIESMIGYRAEEFLAEPELWPRIIHPDDLDAALTAYAAHWETGEPLRLEYRIIARDGSTVWVRDEAYSLPEESTRGRRRVSQGLIIDTSDQKRLEAKLLEDALHDPLTRLANRVLFRDQVDKALERGRRSHSVVAVLFIDLDDFKVVNDSLGHRAGDRLLVEVAQRLSAALRAGDVAARQGGDEFTVMLEHVDGVGGAMATAERLADELARPIELEGRSLVVRASIGIAIAHDGDTATDDLLANADAAMYVAKAQGKACHAVFDPSMRLRARRRLEHEADLRAAIEAEAFEIVYQPIVELRTRRIVALEAVPRWHHPERGLIGPAEFLPLAEATGLIVPLGRRLVVAACEQLRSWREVPGREELKLHVDASVRQATEPEFGTFVAESIAVAGIDPGAVVLEITESLMLRESASPDGALRRLRDAGVGLVIDDFGTGFSGLDYFKRFAVQGLKLDRSFVAGLGRSLEDTAIVTATLAFGAALDLAVTAEGVDDLATAERLVSLGCRYGQGRVFGDPVPAAGVAALLMATSAAAAVADSTIRVA